MRSFEILDIDGHEIVRAGRYYGVRLTTKRKLLHFAMLWIT